LYRVERSAQRIGRVHPDVIAPPIDDVSVRGINHTEKDNDHPYSNTRVECGGEDVIVAHPPPEVIAPNPVVENESGDGPGCVVHACGGKKDTNAREENGDVDVTPQGKWVTTCEEVEWNG
jgi:hypothetical protein